MMTGVVYKCGAFAIVTTSTLVGTIVNAQNRVLFLLLAIVSGCSFGVAPAPAQPTSVLAPEIALGEIRDLRFRSTEDQLKSGQWKSVNGSSVCDGYLSNVANENYCAAAVPGDWRSFTFNGQIYYVQPLSGG